MALNLGKTFPRPTKQYHSASYDAISPLRQELSLKGKTVLITGGATGIGYETTKAFAQAGASSIILVARTEGPMLKAKAEMEKDFPATKVVIHAVSISDSERINALVNEAGTIDILVLNAGMMHTPAPVIDIDPKQALESFETNVLGPMNLVRAFIKLAPRNEGAERTIINTSTAGITSPMPGVGVYNASKGAFTYLMRQVNTEFGSYGIRVFSFHPGIIYTPMAKEVMGLNADQFEYDPPEVAAHFAVWLCSPEADFLRGRFLHAQWDVAELEAKKEVLAQDPTQLTVGHVMDKLVDT